MQLQLIDALRRVVLRNGAWTKEAVNRQLQGQEWSSPGQGSKGTGAQARTDKDRLQAPEVPLIAPPITGDIDGITSFDIPEIINKYDEK